MLHFYIIFVPSDARLIAIYEKAAQMTGDTAGAALIKEIKTAAFA